jgi:signal transduction histidine kinase/CheY-like chemotaxis protein
MDARDQAAQRILRWRFEALPTRLAQVLVIAAVCWLENRRAEVVPWVAITTIVSLFDAWFSRRLYGDPDSTLMRLLTPVSRALSAFSFAAVGYVFLLDRSNGSMAAAVVVVCAVNLNNTVMTRGSGRLAWTLVGPSSAVLLSLPFAEYLLGMIDQREMGLLGVGALIFAIFIVRLAHTLQRENERLHDAVNAAQAASQAKSDFLASMSHEIRTPLNGVLGMAQAMTRDRLSRIQRERLKVIGESGEALLAILNDILDLSKIEAGKLSLEIAEFDLEEVALGAYAAFTPIANRKGLSFNLMIDDRARGVYRGDSVRVRQVLYNLISNAVKFTEAGSVDVRIARERWAREGEAVRIQVCDTGVGVEAERAAQLFDKFVQADSSTTRKFGGTGLGLSICRELCQAMGGDIALTSEPGIGSVFTADLPLPRVGDAELRGYAQAGRPAALSVDPGLRVLAAEDNRVNQLVLRTLLAQLGLEPTIVENGAQALEAWEQDDWDLILMDVQMPVMDGPTAARHIREREARSGRARTPIIALTANVMRHQIDQYLALGMDGIVAKPIEIRQLFEAIAEAGRAPRKAAMAGDG